jgi:hypothetical protein
VPIKIRNEQVAVFTRLFESRFAGKMARHLRETYPREVEKQGLTDDGLQQLALRGLTDARTYGIVNEGDVERYIECMLLLGPQFVTDERFPWAGPILRSPGLDGEAKMDRIDEHLVFELRVGC